MTRTEIISQLDAEITLLQRAREILSAPLTRFMQPPARKVKTILPGKARKPKAPAAPPVVAAAQTRPAVVVAAPQPSREPEVKRVPPKRRMERRQAPAEKAAKSSVALSGLVPAGPVVVSADEARKVSERSAERSAAPPPAPIVNEIRPDGGTERSLGSLIQAFERRAGLSGIETPRS